MEYTGPIEGRHLRRLSIRYHSLESSGGGGTLQWMNLVDTVVEERRRASPVPYTPDWPKFLLSAGQPVAATPDLACSSTPIACQRYDRR